MQPRLFDPLVDDYDAARPDYPDQLYAELTRLAGRQLAGAVVVEVGAGTGIATRAMVARGARVLAVDVSAPMLARLQARSPDVPVVVADAHALPVADRSADLVCYAQAWHWVNVPVAAAEVARVLRPGGALAAWWNDVAAADQLWWQAQQERLEAANTDYSRDYRTTDYGRQLVDTGRFASVARAEVDWVRELDLDTYERWLRSKSYVAALGRDLPAFLAAERASLTAAFPGGRVREPLRSRLWVARVA